MSLLPEEQHNYHQDLRARNERRTNELKAIQERAEVMSQLVADPRWEIYGRYIETLKQIPELRLKAALVKLNGPIALEPKEYYQLKMDQVKSQAAIQAYENMLNIAKTLIEQGEKAVTELSLMEEKDNGTSGK